MTPFLLWSDRYVSEWEGKLTKHQELELGIPKKIKVPFQFKPKLSFNNQVIKHLANYFHTVFNISLLSGSHHFVTQGEMKPHSLPDTNTIITLPPQRRPQEMPHCEATHFPGMLSYPCLWRALFSALNMTGPKTQLHALFSFIFSFRSVLLKGFTLESIRDDLAKMQIVIF